MGNLLQDLRFGARMLLKNPGFTLIAVVTLALGIGANTAIFSVVNAVILRPLPFHQPERLVQVFDNFQKQNLTRINVSVPEFFDYQRETKSFEKLAAYASFNANLAALDNRAPERLQALAVTHELFDLLGVAPYKGRGFNADEDMEGHDNTIIISYGLWQRRFGSDPNVVGRTVSINAQDFSIVGIMPKDFNFPQQTEVWATFGFTPQQLTQAARGSRFLNVIGRLKPNVTLKQAQSEMDTIGARIVEQYPQNYSPQKSGWAITVVPLLEVYVGDIRPALLILLGAVGFVLLIACANVTNLLMARGAARQRELAIRTALGASRLRVVRQLLTESLLLSVTGGVAGLLLAVWGVELLTRWTPANVPRISNVSVDSRVLLFTFLVSLLTGLLFGLIPALQASRTDLNETLKEGGRTGAGGARRGRIRNVLIVSEVALALVLLVGAGLLLKSFNRLLSVDPGFDPNNVLTMNVSLPQRGYEEPPKRANFYREAVERISRLPGVETASAVSILPLSPTTQSGTTTAENSVVGPDDLSVEADWRWITPGYFKTMSATLLKGRYFTEEDKEGSPRVAIVDESFARRFYPNEDAIGKRIKRGGFKSENPWMTIVGIVKYISNKRLDTGSHVQAYFPYYQDPQPNSMSLAVRTNRSVDASSMSASVRQAVQEVDRNQPIYNIRTMQQVVSESVAQQRLSMLLLVVFACAALLLAAVGLYGVLAYLVNMRTHEIGIRMALGASGRDVLKMIVGQGMLLTLIGIAIGLVGAFALTRIMSSLLFDVRATDPVTFIVVSLVLASVAFLACLIPARRATRVDPMTALRYE
ncbi:MAG TPA: ABC transporter permease [Pyrinomonadaceae bacterium]|jgi:putative ABC transport system permease protein